MKSPYSQYAHPPLGISSDKVCYIVVKAREFDVKDYETDTDSGSNAADDKMYSVLENHADDPVLQELTSVIDDLSDEEQVNLVALMWLGRGDGGIEDWAQLHREAEEAHNERTAAYLLGEPRLADHLEEGLSAFGLSCEDFETGHL